MRRKLSKKYIGAVGAVTIMAVQTSAIATETQQDSLSHEEIKTETQAESLEAVEQPLEDQTTEELQTVNQLISQIQESSLEAKILTQSQEEISEQSQEQTSDQSQEQSKRTIVDA